MTQLARGLNERRRLVDRCALGVASLQEGEQLRADYEALLDCADLLQRIHDGGPVGDHELEVVLAALFPEESQ